MQKSQSIEIRGTILFSIPVKTRGIVFREKFPFTILFRSARYRFLKKYSIYDTFRRAEVSFFGKSSSLRYFSKTQGIVFGRKIQFTIPFRIQSIEIRCHPLFPIPSAFSRRSHLKPEHDFHPYSKRNFTIIVIMSSTDKQALSRKAKEQPDERTFLYDRYPYE